MHARCRPVASRDERACNVTDGVSPLAVASRLPSIAATALVTRLFEAPSALDDRHVVDQLLRVDMELLLGLFLGSASTQSEQPVQLFLSKKAKRTFSR